MSSNSLKSPSAYRRRSPLVGFKHLLVGAFTLSSLAFAYPPAPSHGAVPIAPPPPVAAPPPPVGALPPPPGRQMPIRMDDSHQASRLLRAFDDAMARRDMRSIRGIEGEFRGLLQQELREARFDRGARTTLNRLNRIDFELNRLEGRMNPRTLNAKRELYAELTRLVDSHPSRRF